MSNRLLQAIALSLLPWLIVPGGCSRNNQLEKLIEQSPFNDQPQPAAPSRLFVTCSYHPLELPGQVDVTSLSFWSQYQNSTASTRAVGFDPEQLRLWRANGLEVVLAPLGDWPRFRKDIVEAGGVAPNQTITFIRNPTEVADLAGYVIDRPVTMFVAGSDGSLRGYSLAEHDGGDCIFRVNAVPTTTGPDGRTISPGNRVLYVKIVPEFHSFATDERFVRDSNGLLQRVTETPRVVFDQLTLSGLLPSGYFICIGPAGTDSTTGSLGQLFLTRKEGADNYQLLVILVPAVQSADQIKTQARDTSW